MGEKWNLSSKLMLKTGVDHIVLTPPKTSFARLTLSVVEKQQLQHNEEADPKDETCCLKWKINKGGRTVCVNLKTDIDKLNILAYRYLNSL